MKNKSYSKGYSFCILRTQRAMYNSGGGSAVAFACWEDLQRFRPVKKNPTAKATVFGEE